MLWNGGTPQFDIRIRRAAWLNDLIPIQAGRALNWKLAAGLVAALWAPWCWRATLDRQKPVKSGWDTLLDRTWRHSLVQNLKTCDYGLLNEVELVSGFWKLIKDSSRLQRVTTKRPVDGFPHTELETLAHKVEMSVTLWEARSVSGSNVPQQALIVKKWMGFDVIFWGNMDPLGSVTWYVKKKGARCGEKGLCGPLHHLLSVSDTTRTPTATMTSKRDVGPALVCVFTIVMETLSNETKQHKSEVKRGKTTKKMSN